MTEGTKTLQLENPKGSWTQPTLHIESHEVEEILGRPIRHRPTGITEPPEDEFEAEEEEREDLNCLFNHILRQNDCPQWMNGWGFDIDVTEDGAVTFEAHWQPAAASPRRNGS